MNTMPTMESSRSMLLLVARQELRHMISKINNAFRTRLSGKRRTRLCDTEAAVRVANADIHVRRHFLSEKTRADIVSTLTQESASRGTDMKQNVLAQARTETSKRQRLLSLHFYWNTAKKANTAKGSLNMHSGTTKALLYNGFCLTD